LALEPKKMTLAERLAALKAKHAEIEGKIEAILSDVAKSGHTMDAAQKESVTELESEADALVDEIALTERAIARQAKSAKPVDAPAPTGVIVKDPRSIRVAAPKLDPGVAFARQARVEILAAKSYKNPTTVAEQLYPHDDVLKAAVAAATTTNDTWAKPLVPSGGPAADFIEYLRPRTILGRFGTDGIPALRRVPFRTPLIGQTSPGSASWVAEGAAKPLTKFDFTPTELLPLKVAAITVATMELLRDSSPSADILFRNQLAEALIARLDVDFINPAKAASAGVSPASITNGVVQIQSSGTDEAAVRDDIRKIFGAFITANNAPTNGVWIMSSLSALALSLMVGPLGQPSFPGITMTGGTFFGMPVITSEYVQGDSDGSYVVLVNASDIYFGDEGGIETSMSSEASLVMADDPTMNSTTPTPAQMVSMFQTNSVAFRVERSLNWKKRRASAVAVLGSVRWGEPSGSGA
jgi:HK97 family phage major capsid protein